MTEEEIASILGSEEQYSGSEIATWIVEVLRPEIEDEIRVTAEEAVRTVLVPVLENAATEKRRAQAAIRGWQVVSGVLLALFGASLTLWLAGGGG